MNSNPIAASTRVSALNIVADLLKKLDVSFRLISAGFLKIVGSFGG
jgi:hypothetical protein